jgi:putative component of membrane protein insertase Oxa1/YidC/SpoIIIJ protein YidD
MKTEPIYQFTLSEIEERDKKIKNTCSEKYQKGSISVHGFYSSSTDYLIVNSTSPELIFNNKRIYC